MSHTHRVLHERTTWVQVHVMHKTDVPHCDVSLLTYYPATTTNDVSVRCPGCKWLAVMDRELLKDVPSRSMNTRITAETMEQDLETLERIHQRWQVAGIVGDLQVGEHVSEVNRALDDVRKHMAEILKARLLKDFRARPRDKSSQDVLR